MGNLTEEKKIQLRRQYEKARIAKKWNIDNTYLITLFHCISGYHRDYNRAILKSGMVLKCLPEPGNRYDKYTVKVIAPSFNSIKNDPNYVPIVEGLTKEKMKEIAREKIGRVPSDISKILLQEMEKGYIRKAMAILYEVVDYGCPVAKNVPCLKCAYFFEVIGSEVEKIHAKFQEVSSNYDKMPAR